MSDEHGQRGGVGKMGPYSSEDIHRAIFANRPKPRPQTLEELKEGIAQYIREKHAHCCGKRS
ncbi:MAG TPA: hypothetical protein VF883_05250 [Thermoanaerobaculia bacterium]|jgi:hypothetical protein